MRTMVKWQLWEIVRNEPCGYDEVERVVCIACTEQEVRHMAAEHARDEGEGVWLNPGLSTPKPICEVIWPPGKDPQVVVAVEGSDA
jgi:hypothetical protein